MKQWFSLTHPTGNFWLEIRGRMSYFFPCLFSPTFRELIQGTLFKSFPYGGEHQDYQGYHCFREQTNRFELIPPHVPHTSIFFTRYFPHIFPRFSGSLHLLFLPAQRIPLAGAAGRRAGVTVAGAAGGWDSKLGGSSHLSWFFLWKNRTWKILEDPVSGHRTVYIYTHVTYITIGFIGSLKVQFHFEMDTEVKLGYINGYIILYHPTGQ